MIDLEGLALGRARALSQSESEWLEPIRSSHCDEACTVLSDGDIQHIFRSSQSAKALAASFQAIAKAAASGDAAVEECINDIKKKAILGG